jgi:hypothetical protein
MEEMEEMEGMKGMDDFEGRVEAGEKVAEAEKAG